MAEFRQQPRLKAVISGAGTVEERLAGVLRDNCVERPMIVCGERLAHSPVLGVVNDAARSDVVIFDGSRPHTPMETIDAGAAVAREARVDGFVAVGGSSAIDCAKGIARLVATGTPAVSDLDAIALGHLGRDEPPSPDVAPLPLITITTTLSFAEFLPFWGARNSDLGRKLAYRDGGAFERTIFLDGAIAAHTPSDVWAETGIKALDDALSAYCRSADDEPFLDPILLRAISELGDWLPRSMGEGRMDERQHVLDATWMTKQPIPRLGAATGAWFSTAARHALGSVLQIGHGAASCVALPVGVRFHAAATAERQDELAAALGAPLHGWLDDLLTKLGVPRRLSELGHDARSLDEVAAQIVEESPALGSVDDIRELCNALV